MKNIKKLFGIIALVSVIALSFAACEEEDPGNDDVDKYIKITNIPYTALPTTLPSTVPGSSVTTVNITNRQVTIAICNSKSKGNNTNNKSDFELYAYSQALVNNNTVKVPLISATTSKQFTGTGKFYVVLYFDTTTTETKNELSDDTTYVYSDGSSLALEYNITSETSTISFDRFVLLP